MTGNEAGQSADEVARRTREKIERLQRSAEAWEAGAAGEQATGRVLAQLDAAYWRVLHDVPWPGRARANIDHVVIGPPGVFVIDTKNWSGSVTVASNVLRQNGRSREKEVARAAEAGIAVLELVPEVPVHPVLCLVRDEPVDGWVRDVLLCSTANLLQMITTRPAVLSADDVPRVTSTVQARLARPRTIATQTWNPRTRGVHTPRTGRSARRDSGPSLVRLLGFLLLVAVMVGALQTGLLSAAASKFSEVFVGQVVDDEPPADAPGNEPGKGRNGRPEKRDADRSS